MSTSTSHSVERHLGLKIEEYDLGIRRLVPGYDAMVDAVMDALATHGPNGAHVLDLGTGSGRMAGAVLGRFPEVRMTLVDVDRDSLEEARKRVTRVPSELARATFLSASFADPLPACDVAIASLSLHHVHDPDTKRAVYTNIRSALSPRGVLITSDAMVPSDATLKERIMSRWADHMVAGGDTRDEALARFEAWSKEERYFSIDEELAFIRDAGFRAHDVVFRRGPLAVVVAVA